MRKRGFTILEILMVVVISSMFMIFGVARYREFARRQEVVIAKRSIVSDLRQAQKDSISGRKPIDFNGGSCLETLVAYKFNIVDSNTYEIIVECADPVEITLKTVELSSNIQISVPPSNPIEFRPFTLATNIPSGTSEEVLIEAPDVTNSTQTITINWTGEIK